MSDVTITGIDIIFVDFYDNSLSYVRLKSYLDNFSIKKNCLIYRHDGLIQIQAVHIWENEYLNILFCNLNFWEIFQKNFFVGLNLVYLYQEEKTLGCGLVVI